MNQVVQIHDALRGATPTQIAEALARRERRARMVKPQPVRRPRPAAGTLWFCILDEVNPERATQPSIRFIQDEVCAHFNISRDAMISHRRYREYAMPRMIAMHLCRTLTRRSYPLIGQHFGGRDHSTALNADRRVVEFSEKDSDFGVEVASLTTDIQKRWGAQ